MTFLSSTSHRRYRPVPLMRRPSLLRYMMALYRQRRAIWPASSDAKR